MCSPALVSRTALRSLNVLDSNMAGAEQMGELAALREEVRALKGENGQLHALNAAQASELATLRTTLQIIASSGAGGAPGFLPPM